MVRIKDIAKEAKVSEGTVDRFYITEEVFQKQQKLE